MENVSGADDDCLPLSEISPEQQLEPLFVVAICVWYAAIMLTSVLGNGLIVFMAVSRRVSFNVRTVFIGCLALSDLTLSVTSLPVTAIVTISKVWLFPHFACYLLNPTTGTCIFVSSFTLTAIAVDRFFLIVRRPLSKDGVVNYRGALLIVALSWLAGILFTSPSAIFMVVKDYREHNVCGFFCEENWPQHVTHMRAIYGLTILALQFGLPLIICTFCYISIARKVAHQDRKWFQGASTNRLFNRQYNRSQEEYRKRKRLRVLRMMVAMLGSFVIAWLPLNVMNVSRDVIGSDLMPDWYNHIYIVAHCVAMCSTISNPVIYCCFNDTIWQAIKLMLPCCQTSDTNLQQLDQTIAGSSARHMSINVIQKVHSRSEEENVELVECPPPVPIQRAIIEYKKIKLIDKESSDANSDSLLVIETATTC